MHVSEMQKFFGPFKCILEKDKRISDCLSRYPSRHPDSNFPLPPPIRVMRDGYNKEYYEPLINWHDTYGKIKMQNLVKSIAEEIVAAQPMDPTLFSDLMKAFKDGPYVLTSEKQDKQ